MLLISSNEGSAYRTITRKALRNFVAAHKESAMIEKRDFLVVFDPNLGEKMARSLAKAADVGLTWWVCDPPARKFIVYVK